jgi:hypothetical protein
MAATPSGTRQFVFIIIVFAIVIAALFGLSTEMPDDARKLANLMAWIALLSGGFFVVEKVVRGTFARK